MLVYVIPLQVVRNGKDEVTESIGSGKIYHVTLFDSHIPLAFTKSCS